MCDGCDGAVNFEANEVFLGHARHNAAGCCFGRLLKIIALKDNKRGGLLHDLHRYRDTLVDGGAMQQRITLFYDAGEVRTKQRL